MFIFEMIINIFISLSCQRLTLIRSWYFSLTLICDKSIIAFVNIYVPSCFDRLRWAVTLSNNVNRSNYFVKFCQFCKIKCHIPSSKICVLSLLFQLILNHQLCRYFSLLGSRFYVQDDLLLNATSYKRNLTSPLLYTFIKNLKNILR